MDLLMSNPPNVNDVSPQLDSDDIVNYAQSNYKGIWVDGKHNMVDFGHYLLTYNYLVLNDLVLLPYYIFFFNNCCIFSCCFLPCPLILDD